MNNLILNATVNLNFVSRDKGRKRGWGQNRAKRAWRNKYKGKGWRTVEREKSKKN